MKQYHMIDMKSQMTFIVKGINAKDCIKQVKHQLGKEVELIIVNSKRTH